MLEKYLSEKNISVEDIKNLFPDLAELIQSYSDTRDAGDPSFEDELSQIESGIMEKLKEREEQIDALMLSKASVSTGENEESIFEIEIEDAGPVSESQTVGYKFSDVEFTKDGFLKLISILGIDFQPKIKEGMEDKFFWLIDNQNYIITTAMPFDSKVDVYVIGDDRNRDNIYNAVQAKSNSYGTKEQLTEIDGLEADGLTNYVSPEFVEPITKMHFKQLDEAVIDLFKIDSATKLVTLLELSVRKFGCGCGHI